MNRCPGLPPPSCPPSCPLDVSPGLAPFLAYSSGDGGLQWYNVLELSATEKHVVVVRDNWIAEGYNGNLFREWECILKNDASLKDGGFYVVDQVCTLHEGAQPCV